MKMIGTSEGTMSTKGTKKNKTKCQREYKNLHVSSSSSSHSNIVVISVILPPFIHSPHQLRLVDAVVTGVCSLLAE